MSTLACIVRQFRLWANQKWQPQHFLKPLFSVITGTSSAVIFSSLRSAISPSPSCYIAKMAIIVGEKGGSLRTQLMSDLSAIQVLGILHFGIVRRVSMHTNWSVWVWKDFVIWDTLWLFVFSAQIFVAVVECKLNKLHEVFRKKQCLLFDACSVLWEGNGLSWSHIYWLFLCLKMQIVYLNLTLKFSVLISVYIFLTVFMSCFWRNKNKRPSL